MRNTYSIYGILDDLGCFEEKKRYEEYETCLDALKVIFYRSGAMLKEQFLKIVHKEGEWDISHDKAFFNNIVNRKSCEDRHENPTKRFGEELKKFIGEHALDALDTYFLQKMPDALMEFINDEIGASKIPTFQKKRDKLIQDFLNFDDEAITDNYEFNKKAKEIVEVLNRNNEKNLCLFWIFLISIYPQKHKTKDYTRDLLFYWEQSPQLAKLLHEELKSLTLQGVSETIESLVDEDMDITIAKFNEAIEERTSLFEIPGISCQIVGENESFLSAVSQVNTFLCTYPQYQSYIRLILTMPKKKIKSTVLKKLNANAKEDINMLRTKKILFRENEYYYLDYSYQTVIEYMRSVSNDFFTKYSELRSFCYEYYVGKWEEVLILLLIDQRELLSRDEKKFLLSCIKFDESSELVKQVYENAIV